MITKTQRSGLMKQLVITSCLFLCAGVSQAQVSINALEKEDKAKNTLAPNLSVHFTLNSALSQEETGYYKEIVQEILRKIPKRVSLRGDNQSLLSGSNRYDKLRVVSYMPDAENLEDDPTARDIVYFDIDFEKADERKLAQLIKKDDVLLNPSVFARTDKLEAFMRKVDAIRAGEEIDELPLAGVATPEGVESQTISADVLSMVKPVSPMVEAKPEKVERLAKKEVKPAVKVAKSEAPKPKPKAPAKPKVKVEKMNLGYMGDLAKSKSMDAAALETFVAAVKKSGRLDIVGYTMHTPFQGADSIFSSRLNQIKALLEENGVMWNGLKISELRMRTTSNQRIELFSGRVKI